MTANKLKLEIVTPTELAFSDDVDMVILPGVEGELGIYPQHIPVMTQITIGELIAVKDGREHPMAVGEGFAEITFDSVSVVTDMAIDEDGVDEEEVQRAIERAQQALAEGGRSAEEVAVVEASLQKSLAQLNIKRRRKV